MSVTFRWNALFSALSMSFMLAACGGHNDENPDASKPASPAQLEAEPGAPKATGDVATDGLAWFNFRRQQLGLDPVTRNAFLNTSALGHTDYLKTNSKVTISHYQDAALAGYTGYSPRDRMEAAGYTFAEAGVESGEVLSQITSNSGFFMAHSLITAISHRFIIFEPTFTDAGSGASTVTGGATYFNTDFASGNGFGRGIAHGTIVTYPFANQQQIPLNFFSDEEVPDPVPDAGLNEVGFPISVHANVTDTVAVTTFKINPRGAGALVVTDVIYNDQATAAAIIPKAPLLANTTYDVLFVGTVGGVAVTRTWSFTTR